MPAGAQDQLSQLLLEPTLCLCIALFLLQTRCDPYLYSLSISRKPSDSANTSTTTGSVSTGSYLYTTATARDVLHRFLSSTYYFQLSIQASSYPHLAIQNKARYEKLWNSIHNWFPQKLLSLTSPGHVRLSAATASTDTTTSNTRNQLNESLLSKLFQKVFHDVSWEELMATKRSVSVNSGGTVAQDDISSVIDTARSQAMAIHNYYEKYL